MNQVMRSEGRTSAAGTPAGSAPSSTAAATAAAVAAAVADGADPAGVPAALVRPSERITWFIDRAAASVLLRAARPAPSQ